VEFVPTRIADVVLIKPRVFVDERGYFLETWRRSELTAAGIDAEFVQQNHSRSRKGALRGLHYQIERPQGKLIQVVRGTVFDVAVDLRRHSPTYREWVGVELNDADPHLLFIPPGFAHGFLTLSEEADVLYHCTDFYFADLERIIHWNDPVLGIRWPLATLGAVLTSGKDSAAKGVDNAETFP
jgi:dTDP-4-dehydrorhamnose 3,5-epimerase